MAENSDRPHKDRKYCLKLPEEYHHDSKREIPYRALFDGLVDETTAHGLPHIVHARGIIKKVIWTVLTLIMTVAWLYNSVYVVSAYLQFGVNTEISVTTNREILFPAVTVCNINLVRKSKMDEDFLERVGNQTKGGGSTIIDPTGGSNSERGLEIEKNPSEELQEAFREEVAKLPMETKKAWGHQMDDLLVKVLFEGYAYQYRYIETFFNSYYGNCFTINSGANSSIKPLTTVRTGPTLGLKMFLNVEKDDYVDAVTPKVGVRVLVHDQSVAPIPEGAGINIQPGVATAVSIRKTEVSKLGGKYNLCYDTTIRDLEIDVYQELYPYTKYSLATCHITCYQKHLMNTCGCYDPLFPSKGVAFGNLDVGMCRNTNQTEVQCLYDTEQMFQNGTLPCSQCNPPCNTTKFSLTISNVKWPNENYIINPDDFGNNSRESLEDNIAQLEVYFEDINFEVIGETAAYNLAQLFSDIGGAVGLWVGASVLTVFEYAEFILDFLVLCGHQTCKKKRREQNNKTVPMNMEERNKNDSPMENPDAI